MENNDILERVKNLANSNPDLKKVLEEKFPEIKDQNPFIRMGDIFTRPTSPHIYSLFFDRKIYQFKVLNVSQCRFWKGNISSSGTDPANRYLTRGDFLKLVSVSGLGRVIDHVKIIDREKLN